MTKERIISVAEWENGERLPDESYFPVYEYWIGGQYVAYYEGELTKTKISSDFSDILLAFEKGDFTGF